jgi:ABC-type nitrate/sulfonate/bicarbonate transport system permease component
MIDYEDTRTMNARSYALAVLVVCAAMGLWEGFVHWREAPVYLLPDPSRITQTLWRSQLIIYKRSLLRSAKRAAGYSSRQQPTLSSLSS